MRALLGAHFCRICATFAQQSGDAGSWERALRIVGDTPRNRCSSAALDDLNPKLSFARQSVLRRA